MFDHEPLPSNHLFLKLQDMLTKPHIGYVTKISIQCSMAMPRLVYDRPVVLSHLVQVVSLLTWL
nr:hypothetical protein [Bradyrhizobium diazoefficiens]